jgi:hypothetical protein
MDTISGAALDHQWGIFSDGTAFYWGRSAVGTYTFKFDSRLTPLVVLVDPLGSAGSYFGAGDTFIPGSMVIVIGLNGMLANFNFRFSGHFLDKR